MRMTTVVSLYQVFSVGTCHDTLVRPQPRDFLIFFDFLSSFKGRSLGAAILGGHYVLYSFWGYAILRIAFGGIY